MDKEKPEIDEMLKKASKQYEKFAEKAKKLYAQSTDTKGDKIDKIVETVRKQFTASGEFTNEQAKILKEQLEKDLKSFASNFQELEDKADQKLSQMKIGATASVSSLLRSVAGKLLQFAKKADESLLYRSGEKSDAGKLICTKCKHEIFLEQAETVPLCSYCQHNTFRKEPN